MKLYGLIIICISLSTIMDAGESIECSQVASKCENDPSIPRCIANGMRTCTNRRRIQRDGFYRKDMNFSEPKLETKEGHAIHIPPGALIKSRLTEDNPVFLIVSILNSSYFKASSDQGFVKGSVLGVWLGEEDLHNLSEPVTMQFRNTGQDISAKCVFWKQSDDTGRWSSGGCNTTRNNSDVVCSCNHLSFFAVLVGSAGVEDEEDVRRLEYITYIGSSFSVLFTAIIIMLFLIQRKRKPEHSVVIHVQLSGSLFLLHLLFLLSSLGSQAENVVLCQGLGLVLHWALLATFTWTAIEGFHLYLLLVRVFNIYIRRYLLKLSLLGWGVPVITVVICGLAGEYGKYSIMEDNNNETNLCWITSPTVGYITVNGYLGLVFLFNSVIMVVTVVKMCRLKSRGVQTGNKIRQLWKDWAVMLGLSVVLGLPWGLAFITHGPLSLPGIYLFTTLNAFQGVFLFLWFLSITCKSSSVEKTSSTKFSMST